MLVNTLRIQARKLVSLSPAVSAEDRRPLSAGDRNVARLLMLLRDSEMTISALREQGVHSPAQGLYDLLLAGHPIERINNAEGEQGPEIRYRLDRGARAAAAD